MTEDQNDRCHQYATAVGISEPNPAMKQIHSEHPWISYLAAARSHLLRTATSREARYPNQLLSFLEQSELSKITVRRTLGQPNPAAQSANGSSVGRKWQGNHS